MGKMKTKKAASKRFKVTASGRVLRGSNKLNHLLSKKSRRLKRRLKLGGELDSTRAKTVKEKLIPYD